MISTSFDGNLAGSGNDDVFNGTSGILMPGEQLTLRYAIDVDVDALTPSSMNQAIAGGNDGSILVQDPSDSGSDPEGRNPGATGDSGGEDDVTLPPGIGLAKNHGTPVRVGENWSVPVELRLQNVGVTSLENLWLTEDIANSFGVAFVSVTTPVIDATGVVNGTAPGVNVGWESDTSLNVLDGTGLLVPGDALLVTFNVVVDPDADGTSFYVDNTATITANDPANPDAIVQDISDGGSSTTGTNPGETGDQGTSDDPTPLQIADIGLAKQVVDVVNNGAKFDMIIFGVENIGTVDLIDVTLFDDVVSAYAPHGIEVAVPPTIFFSTATIDPSINTAYAGDTTQSMFDGMSGLLAPGETLGIELVVTIDPDYTALTNGKLVIANQANTFGQGIDEQGDPIVDDNGSALPVATDSSDDGVDADAANAGTGIIGSLFESTGAGGFTGSFDDVTETIINVFAFDSFNDPSRQGLNGHGRTLPVVRWTNPRPVLDSIYTGSTAPGTTLNLSIYDQTGLEIGNRTVVADTAGNWLAHFPNATLHAQDSHYGRTHFGSSFDGSASAGLSEFGARGQRIFDVQPAHRLFSGPHFAVRTFTASTLGHHLYSMPGTQIDGQPHRMEVRQTPAVQSLPLGGSNYAYGMQRHFQPAVHPTNYFFQGSSVSAAIAEQPSTTLHEMHKANTRPLQLGADSNELHNGSRSVSW